MRETTRADVLFFETGMPKLKELIGKYTSQFVKNKLSERKDTPLFKAFDICERKNTQGHMFLKRLRDHSIESTMSDDKRNFLLNENGSKAITYKMINPKLSIHRIYETDMYIDEKKRVNFTRFRLSSHNFKIETGRWSRIKKEDCRPGQN